MLDISELLTNFHFLRPLWLLGLLLLPLVYLVSNHTDALRSRWALAIDQALLSHLLDGQSSKSSKLPWYLLMLGWTLAVIAIAGPAWQKLPQPVFKDENALVIVMDLSLSMEATDIAPSRMVRASHKLIDLLDARDQGQTALIVYAGDAHTVSPLTDDTQTIKAMVPALSPLIMPALGSNPDQGIELALSLFAESGIHSGRILLITDGIEKEDAYQLTEMLNSSPHLLSILAVGTEQGGPIQLPKQGFLKERGQIIIAKLDLGPLKDLARNTDGKLTNLQLDESDLQYLLQRDLTGIAQQQRAVEREFDKWHEEGPWLLLLLIPLTALAFRRGWLMTLTLLILHQPAPSYAFGWNDLWQTRDQQGASAFDNEDYETARDVFQSPDWKGSAAYKAGDFESAIESFNTLDNAEAHYNQGNALAKAGQLDKALAAYNQALQQSPGHEDAQFNRKLVEDLLNQNQQQGDQQNPSDNSTQDNGQEQNQSDQDQNIPSSDVQGTDKNQSSEQQKNQQPGQQEQKNTDAKQPQESEPQQTANAEEQQDGQQGEQPIQAQLDDDLSDEERQSMEKWLRRIPDDPAGLLRRKFNYQYQQRQLNNQFLPQDESEPKW